jgi:hypothetical protein
MEPINSPRESEWDTAATSRTAARFLRAAL